MSIPVYTVGLHARDRIRISSETPETTTSVFLTAYQAQCLHDDLGAALRENDAQEARYAHS